MGASVVHHPPPPLPPSSAPCPSSVNRPSGAPAPEQVNQQCSVAATAAVGLGCHADKCSSNWAAHAAGLGRTLLGPGRRTPR